MSFPNLVQWCGLVSVVGGGVYAAGTVFLSLGVPGYLSVQVDVVLLVVLLLAALVALTALARLYALREKNESYRRAGVLVSLAALASVTLLFAGAAVESLVGAPVQQEGAFERGLGQLVPYFGILGLLGTVGGLLVLGTLTLISGVLPRWGGAMILAGNPLVALLLSVAMAEDWPARLAPMGIVWGLVGYAVYRAGARE